MAETTVQGKKGSEVIKTTSISDGDYVLLIRTGNGDNAIIEAKKLTATNVKDNYIILTGDDGLTYRLSIQQGQPVATKEEDINATPKADNSYYNGLIINQVYGGGTTSPVETPISHSFIELYNLRTEPVNLNGLYLWYCDKSRPWQSIALKGVVPPKTSFLIRCGKHNNKLDSCTKYYIENYDQEWGDLKISDKGFSVYLSLGNETPETNPVRSRKDVNGTVTYTNTKYIDLLGAFGKEADQTTPAYETYAWHCIDKNTSIHRIDFNNSGGYSAGLGTNKANKGNNQGDCEPLDFTKVRMEFYRPRSVKDGMWSVFYDKTPFLTNYPNAINISYGENGDTTRGFSFQTIPTDIGYVRYRLKGESDWDEVVTGKELVWQNDIQITLHKAFIHDLTKNVEYEYQVGYDGCWSDIYSFDTFVPDNTHPLKIMWTTDEQSWGKEEYSVVERCARNIMDWDGDFHFHLNTGDISQNASRYFEWFDYYRYYGTSIKTKPHLITCGNNDLIDKRYSDAFEYYIAEENKFANSVYAFDLGFIHFVCLNSNTDYTYVNGDGSVGGYADTNAFLQAQGEWLDQHLTEVEARPTKPRWIIVYAHLSPFTVGRTVRLQRWVSYIEKHKVDLFLCGHNHAYSRSKSLYTGYDYNSSPAYNDYVTKESGGTALKIVDEFKADGITEINRNEDKANGTVYILNQATGFKLSGKEKPLTLTSLAGTKHVNSDNSPWWLNYQALPTNPVYMTVEIGYDKIDLKAYQIKGIVSKDENKNVIIADYGTQEQYLFDSLTINYSDRNK